MTGVILDERSISHCDSLKANNLPISEYTVHPGNIMIKFTGPEDHIIRVSNGMTDKVPDREKQLLILLTENPGYTKPMLAEKMLVSRKTVGEYLKSQKDKGIIDSQAVKCYHVDTKRCYR